jgi:sugar O-acyltransferase (sialic acid O-acetyltransferase NeuD family)
MKNLVIIGAGGFGREILMNALDNPAYGLHWTIKGFLDDRPGILDGFAADPEKLPGAMEYSAEKRRHYRRDYPVVGAPHTYVPQTDDVFLCTLGNPADRRKYAEPVLAKGGKFINLVHPLAAVSTYVSMGEGCIIGPYASLSPDVRLGRFVTISSYTAVSHDVTIGDWCEIGGHCLIAGRAKVGQQARVHPGSVITPDTSVGDGAVVAAGAVVFGDVPGGVTVIGNPAKKLDWKPVAKAGGAKR